MEKAIGPGVGDFVFAVMFWLVERVGEFDDFEVAFVQQKVDGRDCEILGTSRPGSHAGEKLGKLVPKEGGHTFVLVLGLGEHEIDVDALPISEQCQDGAT